MSRVLCIGDLHLPFCHKDYLKFCKKVKKHYKCNRVVFAGDIVDNHALSYHESDPAGMSSGDEFIAAKKNIKPWLKTFPKAQVCIGNHDLLPYRKAKTFGIPRNMIKKLDYMWDTPGWEWGLRFEIDEVQYIHGRGSGKNAALNVATGDRQSTVMGHIHAFASVQFSTSFRDRIFGLNVGCGIDPIAYAFEYDKGFTNRPVLACGVVIDGIQPILVPMNIGEFKA